MKGAKMFKIKSSALILVAVMGLMINMVDAQTPGGCDKDNNAECREKMNRPDHMPGGPGGMEHKPMIPDLTDDQKEKIEALRIDHMKEMLELKNEIGEKHARLQTLTTAEKVNMSEVNKLIDTIGALQTKMMKMQVKHRQDIRELLTEKQRVIFDAHGPGPGGPGKMQHPCPK